MTRNWRGQLLAKTVLAGVAFAAPSMITATVLMAPAADAQDAASANMTGTVVDKSGAPVAGASVKVISQGQGFERSATTDASGEWRVPAIAQGLYTVTITKAGLQSTTAKDLRVQLGTANSYRIALEPATSSEVVVVTGVRPQEQFSQTTTGVSVDIADFDSRMPIARNITAIQLLAPGAVPADSAFAIGSAQLLAPASIGGASGGENAFYVNGLNITNFVNGIGGATVPFYFYQNVDIKTGGYNAEFGRATGGWVNATTKSGSNQFKFAVHGDYSPDSLREDVPDVYNGNNRRNGREEQSLTLEAGGPIIKDHLFFYGLAQWNKIESQGAISTTQYAQDRIGDPFYGIKLDGYITDTQHLEFTYMDTTSQRKRDVFSYNTPNDVVTYPKTSNSVLLQGGESWVGRYTGTFFENLTVSAAYGRSEVNQASLPSNINLPNVVDSRTSPSRTLGIQPTAAITFPFLAKREFYRGDVDYYLNNFFGDHHFRAGIEQEDTTLLESTVRTGGANYTVRTSGSGNAGLGLGANQQYIERRVFVSGGGFDGQNKAIYLQDSWDLTDRLNVQLGWRQDKFLISDPNGSEFLKFDDEQAARLGFAYDVFGDKSAKLYGYFGRFYLPAASNTSFRAAAPAIDISEYFRPAGGGASFTTFDPITGLPTGGLGPQITAATGATGLAACPTVAGATSPGTVACTVRNDGHSPVKDDASATDVKSTYSDQFILGYSFNIDSDWSAGVEAVYNTLGRVSEDVLIEQGLINYCARNNIAGCQAKYGNSGSLYRVVNPGFDTNIVLNAGDALPNGARSIRLTAADLGYPKAKRDYIGVTFNIDRKFDGVWDFGASYTLARSEGNFEGALNSDIGQADAGITEDFDFAAFVPGQYGLLPNHHAHQLKTHGSYSPLPGLTIGSNFSVISPRAYGCIGAASPGYADGQLANDSYGVPANARFCNGLVVDRGSVFTADWIYRWDGSVRYEIPQNFTKFGKLTLRADIFNILNLQGATESNENGETALGVRSPNYQKDKTYQGPRYFRFGFDFDF